MPSVMLALKSAVRMLLACPLVYIVLQYLRTKSEGITCVQNQKVVSAYF